MNLGLAALGRFIAVDASQDSFVDAFGHGRLGVVFVIDGQVVEAIFHLLIHAADAVLDDYRYFVSVGWIVAVAGGDGARKHQTMPVLMLQTFARESGAAGGSTHQEAFATSVGESPYQI